MKSVRHMAPFSTQSIEKLMDGKKIYVQRANKSLFLSRIVLIYSCIENYTLIHCVQYQHLSLAHLSRRLMVSLKYTSRSGVRASVSASVRPCVNIFKLQYLRNQWSNCNQILSETSFGRGKNSFRFWARSDRNSGVHGNG